MILTMLKGKIHSASVKRADLNYEGSISIDSELMDAAGFLPFERVEVYNITNGARFATYAIEGEKGSGMIGINGAAAHLAKVGDRVIICAYVQMEPVEAKTFKPTVVLVDQENHIKQLKKEGVEGQELVDA